MRYLYWLFSLIYQAFANMLLKRRLQKGKELPNRYREKLGIYDINRPQQKLVWVHVASIGEMNSVIPVIKKVTEGNSKISFLVTSVTVSSAAIFAKAELENSTHQFAPLDCPLFVKRFLEHWKPDLGIFIDSELWPNLIQQAYKRCKLLMLNARLSDRSFARWSRFNSSAKFLYGHFAKIYPTSQDDMRKIGHFIEPGKVKFIGNLKYIPHPHKIDQTELATLKKNIGKRKFWLAASTHVGEFSKIMEMHKIAKKQFPDLLTLIAPRHFYNSELIEQEARQLDLRSQIHSSATIINEATEIYIFDQISSFTLLYELADIVFIGGSLIPHGGQNMLEPARYSCAVIIAKHTHNFRNIMEDMLAKKAIIQLPTEAELTQALLMLLGNAAEVEKLKKNAMKLTAQHGNVLNDAVKEIKSYL